MTGRPSTRRLTLATAMLLLAATGLPARAEPPAMVPAPQELTTPARCPATGAAVAIFVRKRELWLCVDGEPTARYVVALGQNGVGKSRRGDNRTPLGTYTLGEPRPSPRFGTFIPIAYPTPEQKAMGLTGGDLGIHGPPRKLPEPDYPSNVYDWTEGCVATGTDAEIESVATFVRERRPEVVIR
ncbi:MAG TPA: L,D-transpeptidase family protein [Anaeromyxobacteraceae bacterium]|nr:L,D-transpeptidase family protein [Anaeromyxobacteraceae bacterium]